MAVTWRKLAAEDDVLLITGATTGATVQAQTFTNGVVSPYVAPASDSTTAVQVRKADQSTAVLTVDTTNSRVGIGSGNTPSTLLHIEQDGFSGVVLIDTYNNNLTANESQIVFRRSRGSKSSPSALLKDYELGYFAWRGWTGTAWSGSRAKLVAKAAEDWTGSAQGAYVWFEHSRIGSTSSFQFLGVDGYSNVFLGDIVTFDTTARRVVGIKSGTAPSTSPADATQLYSEDLADGDAGLHIRSETGAIHKFGSYASLPGLIVNDSGDSAATYDLRAESDTEANMLWLDASADTLYLGGSTNGLSIGKGTTPVLLGTAKYTRHIQIPAVVTGNPANAPTSVDFGTAAGLQFATTGAKYAFCQWEIPDDWDGTDIYFEVDWFPDSGAMSGTDAVRWTVEYRCIAEGETVTNGTSVTLDNGVGGDTGDYSQYQTKHSRMTMAYNDANQPITKQDHVFFKVSRDTAVSGDFGGTVTVPAFEIIYTSTGFPTN